MTPPDADSEQRGYVALAADPPLLAVFALTVVGAFGVQAVSPVLPAAGSALSVSDEQLGLVVTAFFVPAAVTMPFVGAVADAYGRRVVAVASLLAYGAAGSAVVFADSFSVLLALRGVQGVAFPGILPLSIALTGDLYAGGEGAKAQGLRIGANGLASIVVPTVAGVLAALSWTYPFLLFALAFPAAAYVAVALPDTRPDRDASVRSRAGTRDYVVGVAGELNDRTLAVLLAGGFSVFLVRYAVITFVPLYAVRVFDADALGGGLLLSVLGATRTVASPLSGTVTEHVRRTTTLVAATALTTAGVLGLAAAPNVPVVVLAVVVFGVGASVFTPVLNDVVAAITPAARRGGVVSTMETLKIAAIALSPVVFGVVLSWAGFAWLFAVGAVVLLGYVAVAVVLLDGDLVAERVRRGAAEAGQRE